MKAVIIGGTGLVGRALTGLLRSNGLEVVAAAPSTGVNTLTAEGLGAALAGAQVVVDVSNSPSFADDAVMAFFEQSTGNLLRHAAAAGVAHYVALSVVGADRLADSGYMRAKRRQEVLVSTGPLPWSIVRATQFFEFLGAIAASATAGGEVHLSPAAFQPMAARDVAVALAEVVMAPPLRGVREIAGPERRSMAKLVQDFLKATNDPRIVIPDDQARYFGALLDDTSLVPAQPLHLGTTRLETWLAGARPRRA